MGNELPLIGCALNEEQLAARRARITPLQPHVVGVEREAQRVEIRFDDDVDRPLLLELIEAESECCSFFEFDWDGTAHRLEIAIPEQRFRPTLDALAGAITGAAV